MDHPESGAPAPANLSWARLAAVRRSLEWARLERDRLGRAPFLGANCARLLRDASAIDDDLALPPRLLELVGGLDALDEDDARKGALDEACALLEALLPLTQVGATVLPLAVHSTLVLPRRRRDRRGGRKGRGDRKAGDGDTSGSDGDAAQPASDASASDAAAQPSGVDSAAESPAAEPSGPDSSAESATAESATAESATAESATAESSPAESSSARGDGEPTLEQLVARIRREQRRSSRESKPPRKSSPQRLPFHHDKRGNLPLAQLPGVDPDVVEALAAAELVTVADLLRRTPVDVDRRTMLRGGMDLPEEEVLIRGAVHTRCSRLGPGLARREVVLHTRDGRQVMARWIGPRPRGFHAWETGAEVALVGVVEVDESHEVEEAETARLVVYEAEPVGLDGRGSGWMARYDIEGVEDRAVRDVVARALAQLLGVTKDTLPGQVLDRHRLLPLDEALRDAHFPANATGRGRTRMAFEELFLLQLGVALQAGRGRPARGFAHRALHGYLGQLELQHGICLDDWQERAFSDIRRDLTRSAPMTRLLQGDVGAGKGLIALLTAVLVAENRAQVAMVSPDSLTAERRFLFAEPLLRTLGISVLLVGDKISHAQADAIRRGEAHIVFGTHALLAPKLEWRKLGLVVAEERDRYGTVRPASLPVRNGRPDLLVVTTAPIPTSLVFSVFGEFDLSLVPRSSSLRAVPRVFSAAERNDAYELVREQVSQGHQAHVVFPVSEGRDLLAPEDALRFAEALCQEVLTGARFAVYSSAMSREDRFRVFEDFRHRRIDVLVSTTIVEDAPGVDNATIIVVEHADKHDLIRLHRLRSLLHHGTCCFVLGEPPGEEGVRLVDLACQESDGYRLAEIDLQVRGLEALLGDRATEAPDLDWADPPQDRTLLLRARAEAFDLVKVDPELRSWRSLGRAVKERWGDWLGEDATLPTEPPPSRGRSRGRRRRRRRR